ncbi:hypothetical protein [Helcococcus ovis]|uniref:hypothetical protein n=1 Tax=Helcococcus ovis TaxID=72026 RepID=UPI0038BAC266
MIKGNKIEKKPKYGMRKLSLGLCSGILAFGMFFSSVGASRVAFAEKIIQENNVNGFGLGEGLTGTIYGRTDAVIKGTNIEVTDLLPGSKFDYIFDYEGGITYGNIEITKEGSIKISNGDPVKNAKIVFGVNKKYQIKLGYDLSNKKLILSGFDKVSNLKYIELKFEKLKGKDNIKKFTADDFKPKKEEKPKETPKKEKPEVEKPKDTPKKEKPEKVDARVEGNSIVVTNLKDRDTIKYSLNWEAGNISGAIFGEIVIENGKIKLKDSSNLDIEAIKFNGDKKINVEYDSKTKRLILSEFGGKSIVKNIRLMLPDGKTKFDFNKSQFDTPKKEKPEVEKPKDTPKKEKPEVEKPKDTPKKEKPEVEKPKDTPKKEEPKKEQPKQEIKKGWEEIGNKWTYRDEKGNKVISKWIYDLKYKSWYYLNSNGYMVANEWIQYTDNNWYYLLGNGKMAKSEWVYDKGYSSWYYFNNGGDMAANKWIQYTDNNWYYLLGNGKMAKSEWVYDKKYVSWYYFNNGGDMAANKWIQHTDNNWYYLLGNGKMAKSTRINGWYVNSKGIWEK